MQGRRQRKWWQWIAEPIGDEAGGMAAPHWRLPRPLASMAWSKSYVCIARARVKACALRVRELAIVACSRAWGCGLAYARL